MSKVASLTSGLVVKKGQAVPAVASVSAALAPSVPTAALQAVGQPAQPVMPDQPLPTATTAAVPQAQTETPATAPGAASRRAPSRSMAMASEVAEPPAAYYKALTVKLDRSRYETLKRVGLQFDKKSQEIFVEALDAYLAKMG